MVIPDLTYSTIIEPANQDGKAWYFDSVSVARLSHSAPSDNFFLGPIQADIHGWELWLSQMGSQASTTKWPEVVRQSVPDPWRVSLVK